MFDKIVPYSKNYFILLTINKGIINIRGSTVREIPNPVYFPNWKKNKRYYSYRTSST